MKLEKNTDILPFKNSIENRPWGHYNLYEAMKCVP
jgi:hypothetical protein